MSNERDKFISELKGRRIRTVFLARMYPDGESCGEDILLEELVLDNGLRVLFEGLPRVEIKKGG